MLGWQSHLGETSRGTRCCVCSWMFGALCSNHSSMHLLVKESWGSFPCKLQQCIALYCASNWLLALKSCNTGAANTSEMINPCAMAGTAACFNWDVLHSYLWHITLIIIIFALIKCLLEYNFLIIYSLWKKPNIICCWMLKAIWS